MFPKKSKAFNRSGRELRTIGIIFACVNMAAVLFCVGLVGEINSTAGVLWLVLGCMVSWLVVAIMTAIGSIVDEVQRLHKRLDWMQEDAEKEESE